MGDLVSGTETLPLSTKISLKRSQRLGKYRLEKRLGIGGYSEVWKARDCVEGTWVALKIPQINDGRRDNQIVLKEVRLVSQLRHPNILPVKNADIIDGYAVLATELSVGTLADCSKPMSLRRILSINLQVLEGLAYAHSKRLVHCDVTPGNIFLFPNGRAALGDFGICLKIKGRMKTTDDFGTPGYVAPEQAYGKPTYRSDCFAVGLILYEYLTGTLPRWPFKWPARGHPRLCERTSPEFVRFMKKALIVDPAKRFAGAKQMHTALLEAIPKTVRSRLDIVSSDKRKVNWQMARRQAYIKRYKRIFPVLTPCIRCGEPVAEPMLACPWCSNEGNHFDECSQSSHVCPRCHKGVWPQWRFCPWCYGAGFQPQETVAPANPSYHARCKYCRGKLTRFMRYCPWCHRKVNKTWQVWPFPEVCGRCGWSVDSNFWNFCPWCKQNLIA